MRPSVRKPAAARQALRLRDGRRVERPGRGRLPVDDDRRLLLVHPATADVERTEDAVEVEPPEAESALGVLERDQAPGAPGFEHGGFDLADPGFACALDHAAHLLQADVGVVDVRLLGCELRVIGQTRTGSPRCTTPGFVTPPQTPNGQPLRRLDVAPVLGEHVERGQVARAAVRVAAGDEAAADVAEHLDLGLADLHAAPDPSVLLVRPDVLDAEEHPEAAGIDGFRDSRGLPDCLEGSGGEDAHTSAGAVDARADLGRFHEADRLADELGERVRPGPDDHSALDLSAAVEAGRDGVAELDLAFEHVAVGEPEREPAGLLVPVRADPDERRQLLPVQEPSVLADQVEATVLAHAERLQPDGFAVLEREPLYRGDGDPGDVRGHLLQVLQAA